MPITNKKWEPADADSGFLLNDVPDSNVDMGIINKVGDTDAYRSVFDVNDGDDDTKTEPVLTSPPRKKMRAEEKAAKLKVKELEKAKGGHKRPPMVGNDDDNVVDLDPTPVKCKWTAVPTAESDDNLGDQAMSIGSNNNELNVEVIPTPRRDEGKGKGKLSDINMFKADRRNQKVGSNQTVSDVKCVPPKSKKVSYFPQRTLSMIFTLDQTTLYYYSLSDSTSDGTSKTEKFLSGINGWAASIPHNTKPVSKAFSKPSTSETGTSHGNSILPLLTNAITCLSASLVLAKNVMISQCAPGVKLEPGGVSIFNGVLSDEDEANYIEQDAAIASPPKGKKCVTSSSLVLQSPVKTVPMATKHTKKPSNNDIPDRVDIKLWHLEVPVKTACKIIQLIWDALFPNILHMITSTSPVYIITNQ
ncbi:hypothetical protein PILCRDRAFT_11458 [Piloderma croceum F 1598]|uniref:Uncharacterized protein n=1 Tax=Piloderma croceum (strain F 1598) TaxID=765440 RepID=A0A0C3BLP6_PILCF|nr:hypothetical protein PILCRDRAFT_11458 [Piloderma croceum F 1598]